MPKQPKPIPHLCDRCWQRWCYRDLCKHCTDGAQLAREQDWLHDARRRAEQGAA